MEFFLEVLQPAVPYHKWEEYREQIEYLDKEPETQLEAIKTAKEKYKFTKGIFYQPHRPIYHKELYGNNNPVTKKIPRVARLEKIRKNLEML